MRQNYHCYYDILKLTWLFSPVTIYTADPDDPKVQERILGKGEGGCGGVVVGRVVFTEEDALGYDCMDNPCILVHSELAQGHKTALQVSILGVCYLILAVVYCSTVYVWCVLRRRRVY